MRAAQERPTGRSALSTLTYSIECEYDEPSPAPCLTQVRPKIPVSPLSVRYPSGFNGAGSSATRTYMSLGRHPYATTGLRTMRDKGDDGEERGCVQGGRASTSPDRTQSQRGGAPDAYDAGDSPCVKCDDCGGCKDGEGEGDEAVDDELLATHVVEGVLRAVSGMDDEEDEDIRRYRSEKERMARPRRSPPQHAEVPSVRFPAGPGIQCYNTYKQLPILLPPLRRPAQPVRSDDDSDTNSTHNGRRASSRATDRDADDDDDTHSQASTLPPFCPYGTVFPTQKAVANGGRWVNRFRATQQRQKTLLCKSKLEEKRGSTNPKAVDELVRAL
eukprot:Opistho-1_new@68925